jgi:kumamolisin
MTSPKGPAKRVPLPRSERGLLAGARRVGPADPQEHVEVTVVVRRRAELVRPFTRERPPLSREVFATAHGADPADLERMRRFASDSGLQLVGEYVGRRAVVLSGTVAAFSRAFEVELGRYAHPAGTFRCRVGRLTIPSDLAPVIEGVFGLDDRPQAKPHFRIRKATGAPAAFAPPLVAQAYDFPATVDGSGQTIAILELGGGYQQSDLDAFFRGLQRATPAVTAISVDGATNAPSGDPNSADGEVELDIEVVGAVAPGARLGVYFAPNTDRGFLDALTTAIHDTSLKPAVISISWGGPENTWTQAAMQSFDAACQDAATMGISVFAASGDNGATDGDPQGQLTVDFPASSPHVTGCGGTNLQASGATIKTETAWNELATNEGATGGGVSETFPLPDWQQSARVPAAPDGTSGRGVPDVAGDADPATGYRVVVDGSAAVIGGTSAVAPLWAGLIALINQRSSQPAGFLNPLLYSASFAAAFHDITTGSNGGYNAGSGWDPCTGLGSPDGTKLLAAFSGGTLLTAR